MEYYFQTEGYSVGYDGKPLIRQIEIGIQKGEILTLIGPNGAGKSTVLKSIAGQLETIAGTAYLDGRELGRMSGPELARKMAVVFTERLKAELMTCEDVVATGRYPYTGHFGILTKKDREAVHEAMKLVHVTEIRDRDFSKISDGQRQRVMLARAICQEPEIVILDEPTSFLDIKYKLEFLSVLQELRLKRGLTVIMSLHELELAERVSDKILCIRGEFADRFGRAEEIFRPGYIRSLFSMEAGSFDEENTSMELQAPSGEPKVFVIAGCGTGRGVFRELQRRGIPFITGILFDNDVDYPPAAALASEVIGTKGLEPIGEETVRRAKQRIDSCSCVICCRKQFGSLEKANEELWLYAKAGKKKMVFAGFVE